MIYLLVLFAWLVTPLLAPVAIIAFAVGICSYIASRKQQTILPASLRFGVPLWGLIWGGLSVTALWGATSMFLLSFPLFGVGVGAIIVSNIAERAADKLPGENVLEGEKLRLCVFWLISLLLLVPSFMFRWLMVYR